MRYPFGGGIADWTFGAATVSGTPDLAQLAGGVTVTFWDAQTGGTQYTDLLDLDGNPIVAVVSSSGDSDTTVGQIPQFLGPDEVRSMWAQAGTGPRALMVTTSTNAGSTDPGTLLPPLSVIGPISVGAGEHRLYNDSTGVWRIAAVRASVGTPPAGSPLVIDVNRNGTTIFPTQTNRPAVAPGDNTSGRNTLAEVTELLPGDYLTVDVDQVGADAADLVVQILITRG